MSTFTVYIPTTGKGAQIRRKCVLNSNHAQNDHLLVIPVKQE